MTPTDPDHDGPTWSRLTYLMIATNYTGTQPSPAERETLPKIKPKQIVKASRLCKPWGRISVIVRHPDRRTERFDSILAATVATGVHCGNVSRGLSRTGLYRSKSGHVFVKEQL